MNQSQKRILLELFQSKENENQIGRINHPFDILIHSVLNTINLDILIEIYVNDKLVELKASIFSNIEKRIVNYNNAEKLYDNLKFVYETNNEYFKSQKIRKVLEILLSQINDDYKFDFFKTFFYSKYSNDKKRAIQYVDYAQKEIHNELLSEYLNTGNTIYLKPLLNKNHIEFLAKNIKNIWSLNPSFFYKKQIVELISKTKFESLDFLQNTDIDLYLSANLINKKISPKKAAERLDEIPEDKRPLSILNLSKRIEFKHLEKTIRGYITKK